MVSGMGYRPTNLPPVYGRPMATVTSKSNVPVKNATGVQGSVSTAAASAPGGKGFVGWRMDPSEEQTITNATTARQQFTNVAAN